MEEPVELADGTCALGVRVRAVPDKGAANKAVERTVAKWLGVAASRVSVVRGNTARLKTVEIIGDRASLERAVAAMMARQD